MREKNSGKRRRKNTLKNPKVIKDLNFFKTKNHSKNNKRSKIMKRK